MLFFLDLSSTTSPRSCQYQNLESAGSPLPLANNKVPWLDARISADASIVINGRSPPELFIAQETIQPLRLCAETPLSPAADRQTHCKRRSNTNIEKVPGLRGSERELSFLNQKQLQRCHDPIIIDAEVVKALKDHAGQKTETNQTQLTHI
ncbi:hypothetical protein N9L68_00455 [bacterium]|nr:hypothetical protein [bacterium]